MPLQAMMLPLDPATQAYLRSIKELKVCYPAALPPPYVTPDGGLLKDRLLRLADMLPVPLKLSEMADWQAARAALQRGACDIIPHIGTLGREESGLLVSRPMMETDAAILYRGDLRQATFLVSSATDTSAILRELHPGAELRTLRRGESIYSALEGEKNSAYLGDYLQLRYLMREYPADGLRLRRLLGDERVVSYRLMMRNDPELAKFVDTLIRYMPAGTLYTDLSRYMDQGALYINRLHFNDAEQAWLSGRRRVVRLVMNPQLMPYSGINDQGEAKGWSADILNWVTQESGLKYILVPAATKAEAIEKLRSGEADMMAGLPESPELADDFTFSRMISINRFALISKHAISADKFSQLGKQRILVPESLYDPSLLAQLGDQEWVRTDDLSQGITLLQQGKADAMLSELYQLQYPQRTHLLEGLQIKELDDRFGLGFAIRKDQT